MSERLRELERRVSADPSDLAVLRAFADERARRGLELLPDRPRVCPWLIARTTVWCAHARYATREVVDEAMRLLDLVRAQAGITTGGLLSIVHAPLAVTLIGGTAGGSGNGGAVTLTTQGMRGLMLRATPRREHIN